MLGYPSDVTDAEWVLLAPFFARPDPRGNPGRYAKRDVVHAIFYVVKGGIPWRMLPLDFPPWDTVYDHYRRWNQRGVWEQALDALNAQARQKQGKQEHPTYVLVDSQSVKTQYASQDRGMDGGKKIKGRKRHIATDTLGRWISTLGQGFRNFNPSRRKHDSDRHDKNYRR